MKAKQRVAAALLTVFAMGAAAALPFSASAAEKNAATKYGDVNLDRRVTIDDVTTLQRYLADSAELNETALANADVTEDGVVDIADATKIQYYLAGYIDHLPIIDDVYVLAGSSMLISTGWNPTPESYVMTKNADGTYSYTFPRVQYISDLTYQLKVVQFIEADPENAVWHSNGAQGLPLDLEVTDTGRVTVTYDPATETISATGDYLRPTVTASLERVCAAGEGKNNFLGNACWDLWYNEMNRNGDVFTLSCRHVTPNREYTFRFVANRDWNFSFGTTEAPALNEDNVAVFDGGNISFTPVSTADYVNITLTLDLTDYDMTEKTGATFRIDVEDPVSYTFSFTNSLDWEEVYLYTYGKDGSSDWNRELTATGCDPAGHEVYTITTPDGTEGVVLHNNNDARTEDICNFDVAGYYVTDETTDYWNSTYRVAEYSDYYLTDETGAVFLDRQMSMASDGSYTLTLEDVHPTAGGNYRYQVAAVNSAGTVYNGDCLFTVSTACDVTFTYDPAEQELTAEGSGIGAPVIEYITVVGDGNEFFLNNEQWNYHSTANRMTQKSDGTYEITYTGVNRDAVNWREFYFSANGYQNSKWGFSDGCISITRNRQTTPYLEAVADGEGIYLELYDNAPDYADITFTFDLSEYDESTQEGAQFSVKVRPSEISYAVAVNGVVDPAHYTLTEDEYDENVFTLTVSDYPQTDRDDAAVVMLVGDHELEQATAYYAVTAPCDVTFTFHRTARYLGVTGDNVCLPAVSSVTAFGDTGGNFLHSVEAWELDPQNSMTKDPDADVFTLTCENVYTGNDYWVRFAANDDTDYSFGGDNSFYTLNADNSFAVTADAVRDYSGIGFTMSNASCDYMDVTLTLDLTGYDRTTGTGAQISISAVPSQFEYTIQINNLEERRMTRGDDGKYRYTIALSNPQTNYSYSVYRKVGNDSSWIAGNDTTISEYGEVTFTYDPETNAVTATGDYVMGPRINEIIAAGTGKGNFLHNSSWDYYIYNNNRLNNDDGVYSRTFCNVDTSLEDYRFLCSVNGRYDYCFGASDLSITSNGTDTYTADAICDATEESGYVSFSFTGEAPETVDVTITLDLTDWNYMTQTGAELTVSFSEHQDVYRIYGESLTDWGVQNMTQNNDGTWSYLINDVEVGDSWRVWVYAFDGESDYDAKTACFAVTDVCDVTVTYDPAENSITCSGDYAEKPDNGVDYVTAVGNGTAGNPFVNGMYWDPEASANVMTEVSEGVWEITFSNVPTGEDPYSGEYFEYAFKFAANGAWDISWGSDEYEWINETGTYSFGDSWLDGSNCCFQLSSSLGAAVDVTLRIDLSEWYRNGDPAPVTVIISESAAA